ncbi:thiamine-phosphate pyrophosphorylase [Massilia sp. Root418]|uniref:thiamine phosphate synthase n=1 Tax=Massilia sp. Root418 TaxID=1736532 RepID=UPI00070156D0|nr:thiamine phosphate synthase [Massilia sp. Root418]KQW91429.1 thiamine-phosphate pyrophosphorylase [Massilia sp. Root418]
MQGLYLVTPDWDDTSRLLDVSEQALAEGVALLQYRHKEACAELRMEQSVALLALCRRYRVPFIVNDHVDLCLLIGADGVHLGGTDARIGQTRALLGPGAIIGASCYGEMQLALDAQDAGATYVAFGGFYPSRVKQYAVTTQPAILDEARRRIALPRVVIGGMTPQNAAPLVARGAQMVACVSGVYMAPEPARAVRDFNALFASEEIRSNAA